MGEKKTKIVLDADVINHFVRGGKLSLLPKIFPEFQYIVLDVVKKELPMLQYYVKNLKTLWHTATYVYNSPLRCTLQHLADDIENS